MLTPYFNEDHTLFRQSVRQFVATEVAPYLDEWEQNQRIPKEIWKKMGDMGFLGINYGADYGGVEADFFYTVAFLEEISRVSVMGFGAAVGVHQYMSIAHLSKVGSEVLKQKYMTPAIEGNKVGALAISEPGGGSDVAAIRTTAVDDGDHYIINGSKTFITNGVYSDFVAVACRTSPGTGNSGLSLIIIDRDSAGFTSNKLQKIGWHCSDTGELFFDNVRVPKENLIGEEGKGFYYIMDSFQLERLVCAVSSNAFSEHAIALTKQYIHEREAFGRSIKKFQVIRHRLADISTELEAAKHLVYHTCWLHNQGQYAVKESTMSKLLTSELGKKVLDECLQFFGGYGYINDYPISRMYRDVRVGTIIGGTSEIMREILAKVIVDDVSYNSAYKPSKVRAQ